MARTIPEAGGRRRVILIPKKITVDGHPAPKWLARLVAIVSLVLLVAASVAFFATRTEIQLTADGQTRTIITHRRLISTFLAAQHISLGPADEVAPSLDSPLKAKMHVVVYRAVPVTVKVDGRTVSLLTPKLTVESALASARIKVGSSDRVEPSLKSPVKAGLEVVVHRVTFEDVVRTFDIPFTTERRLDAQLERGLTKVVRAGTNGAKERNYRITYEDGKVIGKVITSERVKREPQAQLVAVGTKIVPRTVMTSRGAVRYSRKITMTATAYDPGPGSNGPHWTGRTYLGLKAGYGIVAVDPRVIPLRSRLYIPGYGEALAGDTGGAIKGNRIDLCYNTYREAMNFGRRTVTVYVLE